MSWPTHLARVEALKKLEARLAEAPQDVEAGFERARLLSDLGRPEEARAAYMDVIRHNPSHYGALNNLGGLLYAGGYRSAARAAYVEAIAHHPDNPLAHFNLGNLLREEGDVEAARMEYQTALRLSPDHPEAHRGMALILLDSGEQEAAEAHLRAGFRGGAVTVLPYRGSQEPLPVILLVSAAKGNAPFQQLLSDKLFQVTVIVTEFFDPAQPLPPHRMIVNAIADADLCGKALEAATAIIALSKAPVVNPPMSVRATGRAENAARLANIPDVVAPMTVNVRREDLPPEGFAYPFLLRSPGFHIGQHFERVKSAADLNAALEKLPGKRLSVIQFLDASGTDGKIRKYRAMMINGKIYPAHLAVSQHWKVHYFSADMAENAAHRAEDEAFLTDMPAVLGPRAYAALERIRDALALDYAGIDFGLDAQGRLLLFEANASMTIHPPAADERWAFRRAPVAAILEAARNMLMQRAIGRVR